MSEASEKQIFNDDLLANSGDLKRAGETYTTILHVLNHPELREYFTKYDDPANSAKRRSMVLGIVAIVLGVLAILSVSVEMIPVSHGSDVGEQSWHFAVALVASVLGIASVLFGAIGILSGRTKEKWLHRRLMTERLRQFHFQTFIFRLPEIAASLQSEKAKAVYETTRQKWFDAFRKDFEGRLAAAFTNMIENEQPEIWLHAPSKVPAVGGDRAELVPLFNAYRELRIRHQISYANYKLRDDHKIFSNAARKQAAVLETAGLVCIALLLFIHIAIAIGIMGMLQGLVPASITKLLPFLDIMIISIAVGALAGRALEQGLQPEREIERYQQYRSACNAVLERFDSALAQSEKLKIMMEMERLSFDEMRNFMLTNKRSKFVM